MIQERDRLDQAIEVLSGTHSTTSNSVDAGSRARRGGMCLASQSPVAAYEAFLGCETEGSKESSIAYSCSGRGSGAVLAAGIGPASTIIKRE